MSRNRRARLMTLATAAVTSFAFLTLHPGVARAAPVTHATDTYNYAGVVAHPSKGVFDHVLARWVEPRLHCGTPARPAFQGQLGIWAGLGTGNSTTEPLVQAGTVSECSLGVTENHVPFFEIFPEEGVTPIGEQVTAGDVMQAEVWAGSTGYQLAVRDVTRGWDTGRIPIALGRMGGARGAANARGQAAWVAERPTFPPGDSGCAQDLTDGTSYRPVASFDDESTAAPDDLVIRGETGSPSTVEAMRVVGIPAEAGQVLMEPRSWAVDQGKGATTARISWRAGGCGLR